MSPFPNISLVLLVPLKQHFKTVKTTDFKAEAAVHFNHFAPETMSETETDYEQSDDRESTLEVEPALEHEKPLLGTDTRVQGEYESAPKAVGQSTKMKKKVRPPPHLGRGFLEGAWN